MKTLKSGVLIYGYDPELLETRSWVLERNGFEACTASNIAQAKQTLGAQLIDLVLICHTIPSKERWSAVAAIQAIRPKVKVMLVTTAATQSPKDHGKR
jgi:DNA-binding response OmpR family regulator